jgi:hypothetical protein
VLAPIAEAKEAASTAKAMRRREGKVLVMTLVLFVRAGLYRVGLPNARRVEAVPLFGFVVLWLK